VFSSGGEVVDVSVPDRPVRAGKFSQQGQVLPHPDPTKAIMLSRLPGAVGSSSDDSRLALRKLNLQTFREDLKVPVDGTFGNVHHFVAPLPNTFAFIDNRSDRFGDNPQPSRIRVITAAGLHD
jgi:hypothetical protein